MHSVAIAPDGTRLATGGDDGSIRTWDAAGSQRSELAGHRRGVQSVAIAPPRIVTPAVRLVATLGITSLLELNEQQWRAAAATRPNQSLIFLLDARYAIEALRDGIGWEAEYGRDVWRLDRLPGIAGPGGRPCPRVRLRFDRITHPRLRELGNGGPGCG